MKSKNFETIVSVLVNSKIEAEKFNKNGINSEYIKNIDSALVELKGMKDNEEIE